MGPRWQDWCPWEMGEDEGGGYALPVSRVIDKVAQSRYNRLRCVVATAVTLGYEFLLDWTIGLSC